MGEADKDQPLSGCCVNPAGTNHNLCNKGLRLCVPPATNMTLQPNHKSCFFPRDQRKENNDRGGVFCLSIILSIFGITNLSSFHHKPLCFNRSLVFKSTLNHGSSVYPLMNSLTCIGFTNSAPNAPTPLISCG